MNPNLPRNKDPKIGKEPAYSERYTCGNTSRRWCIPKTDIRTRISNIFMKNDALVPWIWVDIQNFLYNKALRFYLEGSGIFLNVDLPRYKELEMSQGLVYISIVYI